ncbi:MAG: hypothetical protein V4736_12635 [Bdellovibrionota bacterium]
MKHFLVLILASIFSVGAQGAYKLKTDKHTVTISGEEADMLLGGLSVAYAEDVKAKTLTLDTLQCSRGFNGNSVCFSGKENDDVETALVGIGNAKGEASTILYIIEESRALVYKANNLNALQGDTLDVKKLIINGDSSVDITYGPSGGAL